jgi:hypothetical protein
MILIVFILLINQLKLFISIYVDAYIREHFQSYVEAAINGKLSEWKSGAYECLALTSNETFNSNLHCSFCL